MDPDQRFEDAGNKFAELVRIMSRLRSPGGCPWDLKQTFDSIKPYLLEESYEVLDAIDDRNWDALSEELGDLLLQPVFLAEIASSQQLFDICASLDAINQKLIRRHPHVFGDAVAETPEDVKVRWDQIKSQEKPNANNLLLDTVPRNLPALVEAQKVSHKAADVGFEWPHIDGVLEKLTEETKELSAARQDGNPVDIEHEVGDLLFTLVNVARFLKIDAEQALRKATGRFRKRFGYVETSLKEAGAGFEGTSLDRMEELWQQAKRNT